MRALWVAGIAHRGAGFERDAGPARRLFVGPGGDRQQKGGDRQDRRPRESVHALLLRPRPTKALSASRPQR